LSEEVHLLNALSTAAVNLAATQSPSVPATTDEQYRDYGPGFVGFLATGAMVIVVIFLIWDMTRRIRRIRYQSEQQERQAELVAVGEEEAAQRKSKEPLEDADQARVGSSPADAAQADDEHDEPGNGRH
jgi:flagellar biosynthesis/type III secretory pathway M-ring protein FliF/YscJ